MSKKLKSEREFDRASDGLSVLMIDTDQHRNNRVNGVIPGRFEGFLRGKT